MFDKRNIDPVEMSKCDISVSEEEYSEHLAEATEDYNPNRYIKPYSEEDYADAKQQGLDLDNWNDYKQYSKMEEYCDELQDGLL